MKTNKFSILLSTYFLKYIPERTGYSSNTTKAYRDTFILFFKYHKESLNFKPEKIDFTTINQELIENFLLWLKTDKNYSVSSINQRLAGIRAFFRYVQMEAPEYMELCNSIIGIKSKRIPVKPMNYLSIDAIKLLLSIPDTSRKYGIRNLALLTLLYDSGARVQELADLLKNDIRIKTPTTVQLTGKGDKTRIIPIMPQTAKILKIYMNDTRWFKSDDFNTPLFFNKKGDKLTRAGIAYILNKYVSIAKLEYPEHFCSAVSPHTLRHSKGMHLLEGGVNLIYIRDFLGHSSVVTTEIYAKSNPEVKRKAIEAASQSMLPKETYSKNEKADMEKWLKDMI
jgi:site-specific recombinase XerD